MAKGPEAFRSISETAEELGVPQHILRFWETRFPFIHPMKRAGGRRFYRPRDIEVLGAIHRLLRVDHLSISDVLARHREGGVKALLETPRAADAIVQLAASGIGERKSRAAIAPSSDGRLREALTGLLAAKARLDAALGA